MDIVKAKEWFARVRKTKSRKRKRGIATRTWEGSVWKLYPSRTASYYMQLAVRRSSLHYFDRPGSSDSPRFAGGIKRSA